MKKILLLLLAVGIVAGLCACGGVRDGADNSSEVETIIVTRTNGQGEIVTEVQTVPPKEDGKTDPDKNEGGENSSLPQDSSVVSNEWGTDGFTHLVPEPEFGKLKSKTVSSSGDLLTVSFSGATFEDAADYLEKVKEEGFTKNVIDMSSGKMIMFFADNSDESYNVGVGYADGTFTVMVLRNEKR